jgi:hypothetical protein
MLPPEVFLSLIYRRWPSNSQLETDVEACEQRLVADRIGLRYPSDLTVVVRKQGRVRGLRQQFDGKALVAP